MKYLIDPKDKKESVTMTFLVISFVLFAGAAVLTVAEVVNTTGSLSELFYASAALYFGRRIDVSLPKKKGNK